MNILIRKFANKDGDILTSLMIELGYSLSEKEILNNITEIRQKNGEIFVAEYEGNIVGCICSIIDVRLAAGKYAELVSLVVSDKYRGIGIGKNLVQHAEAWLCERVDKIRVRANTIRTNAHGFYNSIGYKENKSQKIFIKNV